MAFLKNVVLALALFASSSEAKVYFKESFGEGWENRWVESTFPGKEAGDMGKFEQTAGKWYGDESDKGIQTSQDAKHYGLSALMDEPFTNTGDLVLQYSVKHEQKLDCGGAYIKLASKADQSTFSGDTPYQIMFGPDVCGGTKKTHVIFNYPAKDDNLEMKKTIAPSTDQKSHLYTLVVKADGTYEVFIDEVSKSTGTLEENWSFLEEKEIKDPDQSKPEDWVDAKKIADPAEVKPEGYDDIAAKIPDPEAEKPEDWDDEDDGEWEPPTIDNPEFKGVWKPTMIDNPDYTGPWEHPMVSNPDYKEDSTLSTRCTDCAMIGFELWQVKSGTIFDDIIVTDSIDEAKAFAQETFFKKQDGEKAMFDQIEEDRKATEKAERDAKAAEEGESGGADEYDDSEEEEHDEL